MPEIPYRSWSLIARDLEPPTQEPTLTNPPLMTNLALDAGGSLSFDLRARAAGLTIQVTTTAMSADHRAADFLQVLTGEPGQLRAVPASWSRAQDGTQVTFDAAVGAAGPVVKLHMPAGATLVVSAVAFDG